MLSDWVTAGAAFGVKAFAAIVTFGLLCAAVVGLLSIGGMLMGGEKSARQRNEEKRRPYRY